MHFQFWWPTNKNVKKRKFQNALKYDLNDFWYRFRVRRCPETPKEPISADITSFWAISANMWKIEFSSELTFLMILWHTIFMARAREYCKTHINFNIFDFLLMCCCDDLLDIFWLFFEWFWGRKWAQNRSKNDQKSDHF